METEWEVRTVTRSDHPRLLALQARLRPTSARRAPSSRFVRICCESFADVCFVAAVADEPIGFLLCFVRDREAYCTTMVVAPEYRDSQVVHDLLSKFVSSIADRVDSCWFTLAHDDAAARALHRMLGARGIGVRVAYADAGEDMISLRIDRARFEEMGAALQ
jgi:ribosomal protein S18 acetylase RimI-like enzyme